MVRYNAPYGYMNMKNETEYKLNDKKLSKRKFIIAVVIFLCIIAGYIYKVVTWTPIDSEFKKTSESVIREKAAQYFAGQTGEIKDPNDLTDDDLAQIKELELDCVTLTPYEAIDNKLYDISLLEKFTNLQILIMRCFYVPEKNIPNWIAILAKFGIYDIEEKISIDIRPLEKLHKLQQLEIEETQLSDLKALKGLKNLKHLYLFRTNVSDLKPLKGLSNLIYLNLRDTKVSDLEPIKDLKNIQSLELGGTRVSNLAPLGKMVNLSYLGIAGTQVSDIEPLKELVNLKTLYLEHCKNISGEQVEELKKTLPELKILR